MLDDSPEILGDYRLWDMMDMAPPPKPQVRFIDM